MATSFGGGRSRSTRRESITDHKLYNYADDNTLSHSGPDLNGLVKSLEKESAIVIDWFVNNKMKANPDKFQVIAIGNK